MLVAYRLLAFHRLPPLFLLLHHSYSFSCHNSFSLRPSSKYFFFHVAQESPKRFLYLPSSVPFLISNSSLPPIFPSPLFIQDIIWLIFICRDPVLPGPKAAFRPAPTKQKKDSGIHLGCQIPNKSKKKKKTPEKKKKVPRIIIVSFSFSGFHFR